MSSINQNYVVEALGQAQHPVIKAFTLNVPSISTEPVDLCINRIVAYDFLLVIKMVIVYLALFLRCDELQAV